MCVGLYMNMCLYECVFAPMYLCVDAYMSMDVCEPVWVYVGTYMYDDMYLCMCACMYSINVCMGACM